MSKAFCFVFPESLFYELKTKLLEEKHLETQGFLFGTLLDTSNEKRILIRDFWIVPENEYKERTGVTVRPSSSFLNKAATYAFLNNFIFIDIHTHPFAKKAWFSSMDRRLAEDIKRWVKNFRREKGKDFWYAHMVMTPEDIYGEVLDPETLEYVPAIIKILKTPLELQEQQGIVLPERFDRSIRVWARKNQEKLSRVKVAIVGLGGLGWNIAESLARIGVRRFILIDGDKIEDSNLSRLLGAKPKEIGKYKVEAMFQRIMEFWDGNAEVDIYPEFISKDNISKLKTADILVGAVDNQLARLVLNEASTRYLIPYFDLGIRIDVERKNGKINLKYQGGQIFFINPGTTPCLACYDGFFDFFEIAQELMSEEEKQIRRELGYITNTQESPSPNVLPLNLFAVSLFTNIFVNFITGIGDVPPLIHFDLTKGSVKYYNDLNRYEFCCFCSNKYGNLALGDLKSQRVFIQETQNSRNISP